MANKQNQLLLRARQTPGKCGFVQVYEEKGDKDFQCIWEFMPKKNNPNICFLKKVYSNQFIMIDQFGGIGRYDIHQKKELVYLNHKSPSLTGYGITPDQNTGFYCYPNPDEDSVTLITFNTNNLIQTGRIEIINHKTIVHLTALNEHQLIGYLPAKDSNHRELRDGCIKINLKTGETEDFYLEPSPSGNYSPPPVAFSSKLNLGARPCFEPIEIIEAKNEKRYLAKVLLFSLTDGKKIRNLIARSFSPENLFEDDDPSYALSCLELSPLSEEYRDLRDEFLERFEEIAFCHSDNALWVSFQHGLVARIDLERESNSCLIGVPLKDGSTIDNPYVRTGFNTPLSLSDDDSFLTFGSPEVTFAVKELDLEKPADPLIPETSLCKLSPGEKTSDLQMRFSWNTIQVGEQNGARGFTDALIDLYTLTEDIDSIRDGDLLRFRFSHKQTILSEETFFQNALREKIDLKTTEGFLKNLISFSHPLWYNSSIPAGFFAIKQLTSKGIEYLELLQSYIRWIKENSTEISLKPLVATTIQQYGWCQKTIDLLLTYARFHPQQGIDFLQEILDSKSLKNHLAIEDNSHYFKSHILYQKLSDDYFPLLCPTEDRLFTAIEQERSDDVLICLGQPIDLEVQHPEFQMSPLELACELENMEIINLLIDKGADIQNLTERLDQEFSKLDQSLWESPGALEQRIDQLKDQRDTYQADIFKLEFDHMLSLSTMGEERTQRLGNLTEKMLLVQKQIKTLRLLANVFNQNKFNDLPSKNKKQISKNKQLIERSDGFIDNHSYAYEDLKAASIYIKTLDNDGVAAAFEQMVKLSKNFDLLISGEFLRINFCIEDLTLTEKEFAQQLEQISFNDTALRSFFEALIRFTEEPLWYDEETPSCFHLLRLLVLNNKNNIPLFLKYLNSGLVPTVEEPSCITDFVFEIYDHFDWCEETLELVASRICIETHQNGFSEFRLQYKKGGLKEALETEKNYQHLMMTVDSLVTDKTNLDKIFHLITKLKNSDS